MYFLVFNKVMQCVNSRDFTFIEIICPYQHTQTHRREAWGKRNQISKSYTETTFTHSQNRIQQKVFIILETK